MPVARIPQPVGGRVAERAEVRMRWPMESDAEAWSKAREKPVAVEVAMISIAISLKRIADAFNEPNAYGEVGSAAIANSIARGIRGQ